MVVEYLKVIFLQVGIGDHVNDQISSIYLNCQQSSDEKGHNLLNQNVDLFFSKIHFAAKC